MKVAILPSAQDDLAAGFAFYERQQASLGGYFLESLFSDIDSLPLYTGIHLKVFGYHRLLAKRFPYAVYYDHDSQAIRVWAVLDCRRDPSCHIAETRTPPDSWTDLSRLIVNIPSLRRAVIGV